MFQSIHIVVVLLLVLCVGCTTTPSSQQQRAIAPPIPTPAPIGPGQVPPPPDQQIQSPPPGVQGNIPLPPGNAGVMPPPGVAVAPQTAIPSTPEQARVQATASRIYSANRWLTTRPRWVTSEGEGPGVVTQSDNTVVINGNLVRSASDGQLAAIMCMQLGDMMTDENKLRRNSARQGREASPPPDYYQQRDGMSSTQAALEIDEQAKFRNDPRYARSRETNIPTYDSPTCARQALVNAGFSELELESAMPLIQRYPIIRTVKH